MKEILEIKFTVYPRNDVDCKLPTEDCLLKTAAWTLLTEKDCFGFEKVY